MAEKSLPTRLYENVMGTPEQNAAAEKRMEERDKKNPESLPAKINKAAKAVTGKKSDGERATFKAVRSYPYGSAEMGGGEVLRNNVSTGVHFKDSEGGEKKAREYASEMQRETRGMKKGGMTASKRADGIAQRGKTRGKMY